MVNRFVNPLLSNRIVAVANHPGHFGGRRFLPPSYGGLTGTIKSRGTQLIEHSGKTYRVAPGSETPRLIRKAKDQVEFKCGTYRLSEEIERVTSDSADVIPDGPPALQKIIAGQMLARVESQAEVGANIWTALELSFEIESGQFLADTTLWTHSATLSGTDKFTHPNSDPIKRLEQLCADVMGGRRMAMGYPAWNAIAFNEKVRTSIPTSKGAHKLMMADFATFAKEEWGIEEVVVSRAKAKVNGAAANFIWGDFIHVGSPAEDLVPVGDEYTVSNQSIMRVTNPVPDQSEMTGRVGGVEGEDQDGYLIEIIDYPDIEQTLEKLSRRGIIVPLIADAGGTLLDVA